jgi:hypothetical protein
MSVATFPPSVSPRLLAEYAAPSTRKLVVDRVASTVSGVKLMGRTSKNGREFTPAAMQQAYALAEGAKINVNHLRDLTAPRDYGDRFGSVLSRMLEADGIFGTVKVNAKHPLAEQFFWDAEHAPEHCGFSIVYAPGKTSRTTGGKLLVESIASVRSFDLVADPATTNGLAEGVGSSAGGAFDSADFIHRLTGRRVKPLEPTAEGRAMAEQYLDRGPMAKFVDSWKPTEFRPNRVKPLGESRASSKSTEPFDSKRFARRLLSR